VRSMVLGALTREWIPSMDQSFKELKSYLNDTSAMLQRRARSRVFALGNGLRWKLSGGIAPEMI
jgi:hypothetical protein